MLYKLFGFDSTKHSIRTEIVAGVTTFLTMAYILAVNPSMFGALADQGMPTGAVFTATALASIIGTLVMAVYAKKPFGLAPGMGLNAFFVFTVCLGMGYTWQFALTAILIEGIVFILLTVFKIRELIVGVMMCTAVAKIDFEDMSEAIPAFCTFLLMPLCYSISDGIMLAPSCMCS